MADSFITALFGAAKVKASARVKYGNETRTVNLHNLPADTSEASFADAAKSGVDLSVRVKADDERTRTINGKGVFGAAAVSATCSVLGFTPVLTPAPAEVIVEQPTEKPKGRKGKDGTGPSIG